MCFCYGIFTTVRHLRPEFLESGRKNRLLLQQFKLINMHFLGNYRLIFMKTPLRRENQPKS